MTLLLGVAFNYAMYGWQLRYEYAIENPAGSLVVAIPFAGLAVMVAVGMSRVATILSWVILAALTGLAYVSAATTDSSTAPLAFLLPFFYGGTAVSIVFAIDRIVATRREVERKRGG